METIEVPVVQEIPDPLPSEMYPISHADFVMTALLGRQPAKLHAEFQDGNARWLIKNASDNEECIKESKDLGEFRAILARFGYHYMNSQLYGGHIRRIVTQQGKKFYCEIFMSNQGSTGFWIRANAYAFTDTPM